ncbi:MAG TPA: nucleoside hydrolase-like domain-containing protein [Bacteroidales bacterium]|nr:nucleoside hydrolase-like domain-containing protein [Bacteroidales bacterium]
MKLRALLLFFSLFLLQALQSQPLQKNRLIVLTDIENEPDDSESMVRLLLYSNQIDIEGIIATTSCWFRNRVAPESIRSTIMAYEKVYPNLVRHEPGFPEPSELLSKVKQGLPVYGMGAVGDGKDSEGSEWIISVLEKNDERPVYVSVWGGANTLAQALYKIRKTKSKADAERLVSKLRVYTISDQDDTGIWMRNNFPGLFYIVTPGDYYAGATWSGINTVIRGIDNSEISNSWLAENIQTGHGPLGLCYPDVAWGMEGDTPSYLWVIPNGLNEPEHPDWGGWGGRYELYKPDFSKQRKGDSGVPSEPETRAIWTNAEDSYNPYVPNEYGRVVKRDSVTIKSHHATLMRWRKEFQNDFAARMDWTVKSYEEANHPPVPALAHSDRLTVKSGERFYLDATGTKDPDNDHLSYLWFHYPEPGSYKKLISITPENTYNVFITAPRVEKPETAHFILMVTDKGEPRLTRYKRIIVTILP